MTSRQMMALLADRRGAVAVEFALCLPMLLLLTFGAVDYGAVGYTRTQLQSAVLAGELYVVAHPTSSATFTTDSTSIQNAVTNATPLSITASTPTLVKGCIVNNAMQTTTGTTCADGTTPGNFVQIGASASVVPIVSWSGVGLPNSLSVQGVVRTS